jgi:arsenate reductase
MAVGDSFVCLSGCLLVAVIAALERPPSYGFAIVGCTILTVYEKPTCTTCRKLHALLTERGVDFESVEYHVSGIAEDELRELLRKAGVGPRELLRTREPLVEQLALDAPGVSDEQLIARMVEHPELVQRPIVVNGERALLARPIERVLELL